ncbi:MAG: pyridoxal-phosphate dependent enzyme, partial [Acidimicrobiales bacterium]
MTLARNDGRHSEIVVNDRVESSIAGVITDRDPLRIHRHLPGYVRTPLVDCPTLASALGLGHVWVKNESSRLGLPSFKMLGASYAVYRALYERLGEEPDWSGLDALRARLEHADAIVLSAATDGNHGCAVARMGRLLGLDCRIYVPRNTVSSRIKAIEQEGASVTVVDGGYDDAIRRSAQDADRGWVVVSDTSWPGYELIPGWVIEGYSTMFWEIEDELAEIGAAPIDVAVVPVGVGALAAAAVRHFCNENAVRRTD